MFKSNRFHALLLVLGLFISLTARAQSQPEELGPLPTTLSAEQLQSLLQLGPGIVSEPAHPRRRLPKPVLLLTPEEISYREAVQKLGVDTHHFVHCDLLDGRVHTGVITNIRDDGFMLKDGIIFSRWIRYTELKSAPRPVAAVGTRIGQGFKWAGLVAGCIAASPLLLVYFPLLAAGVIKD